jgi:ABC-type multidrug transport system ATPase subunit
VTLAIQAHQLTKRYRNQAANRPALDRLDLNIPPGHLYGLVGPDGSGKTTAIRILTSAMPPTSGSARIAGFDILRQADKARPHIGYMPQAFSLYPDLSVIENLNFFADINGVPVARRKGRIAELLEFSRLTDFQSAAASIFRRMRKSWRWPAPSSTNRRYCCSTSRPQALTRLAPRVVAIALRRRPARRDGADEHPLHG